MTVHVPHRVESHFDLELRAAVMHDILDMMPEVLYAASCHSHDGVFMRRGRGWFIFRL